MFYSSARMARRTGLRPVAAMTALATAGLALTAAPALATQNADGTVTVDVLGITDFHGRVEADNKIGGAAVLAGAVRQARQANPDTVFVSSGDSVGASTFTSASQQDKPTLDVLNAMGLNVSALGNHEFDKGAADLKRINDAFTFPYVSANVTGFEAYGITNIDPSYTVTTASGVRVGFIGVPTPALPSLVSPSGISKLQITDMAQAANAEAAKLTDGNEANGEADIVVVLAHDGVSAAGETALTDGSDFAKLVAGVREGGNVDAVMGGHTHVAYIGESGGVRVTQAGQYSELLTKISFEYNPGTGAVTSQAENVSLAWQNWDRTTRTGTPAFPPAADVQQIVDDAVAQANVQGAQKIGEISADITRARQTDGKTENRGGESTLGNLIADLQLAAVADLDVDVALMNPGGIRADLLYGQDGTGTYKDAALVQPFANSLKTFTLTGEQLVAALEQQWQPEGASRPFLKLGVSSNLTYVYDYDAFAESGERILEVWLDGEPITADQQIKVAANSFLADGGDNFTALAQGTGHADAGRIDLDVMLGAFRDAAAAGKKIAPPPEQRAVGLSLSEVVAGQRASLAVSSMAFSAQPDLAGDEVTMTLGADANKVVLTSPMSKSLPADGYDDAGFADFYFVVPAEYEDTEQPLTITDGVTTVELTVLVDAPMLPASRIAGGWGLSASTRRSFSSPWAVNWARSARHATATTSAPSTPTMRAWTPPS